MVDEKKKMDKKKWMKRLQDKKKKRKWNKWKLEVTSEIFLFYFLI